jgi:hypothetical protein
MPWISRDPIPIEVKQEMIRKAEAERAARLRRRAALALSPLRSLARRLAGRGRTLPETRQG